MGSAIGGYFELELPFSREAGRHQGGLAYQSARAAFFALLRSARPRPGRIWMPYFICDAMIAPLRQLGIEVLYYPLDNEFGIAGDVALRGNDWLLYVNYFGICSGQVQKTLAHFPVERVVIDCSQAWFEEPASCMANIYSPRKFFGVPDGGILYSNLSVALGHDQDEGSFSRMGHLLKRLAGEPESGYGDYLSAEAGLGDLEPRRMSSLTHRLLASIDQQSAREARNRNYAQLHAWLGCHNALSLPTQVDAPLCYPFLCTDQKLRGKLLARRIFTPTYWNEVLNRVAPDAIEAGWVKGLIPLPVDHRYGIDEMEKIARAIHE
ncbi:MULTISPECIES: hypothetical protein [Delftia]|jgi:hypothetical protein|uniref:hypothetical protein n=1 Tax=Delftia TaxID=80865 RepID=UPI000F8232EF|nr:MULTISPECIES: hypothetical protein [Delftia]MDH0850671.1 hypothetical protein [Delftia tsuruhatensis]WEL98034.1 hypothetical protein PW274_28835 [Delftia tsuruhatensis]WQM83787.1 hypothetical protein RNT40_02755 [Delftia tsuruhatensis]